MGVSGSVVRGVSYLDESREDVVRSSVQTCTQDERKQKCSLSKKKR